MAWGSSFDKPNVTWFEEAAPVSDKAIAELPKPNVFSPDGCTWVKPKRIYYATADIKAGIREHINKVPTHDPYTNPNAHIYYECNCGQILDPGTKRFAELNNCASKAGWKIRFSDSGYTPYCVECGKGVE